MSGAEIKTQLKTWRTRLIDSWWKVFQGLAYTTIMSALIFGGRELIVIEKLVKATLENTPKDIAAHQQEHIVDSIMQFQIAENSLFIKQMKSSQDSLGAVVNELQNAIGGSNGRIFKLETK